MTVNVKLNNIVWLLTGRSTGFVYPMLNTYITVPYVADARVIAARKMLKLDVRGTDFFTYGALAALYSSLYYLRDLDVEQQAAFIPGVMPITYSGADVYQRVDGEIVYAGGTPQVDPDSNSWSVLPYYGVGSLSVISNPMDWDEPYDTLRLVWDEPVGGPTVTVTKCWLGNYGASEVFSVDPLDVNGNTTLDAFEFAGIRVCLGVSSTTSLMNTPPTHYPYGLLRSRIADDSELVSLMLDMGTIAAFNEASSDMAAVGALAAAIVRKSSQLSTGPDYDVELTEELQAGVSDEMQLVVKFDGTKVDTSCA